MCSFTRVNCPPPTALIPTNPVEWRAFCNSDMAQSFRSRGDQALADPAVKRVFARVTGLLVALYQGKLTECKAGRTATLLASRLDVRNAQGHDWPQKGYDEHKGWRTLEGMTMATVQVEQMLRRRGSEGARAKGGTISVCYSAPFGYAGAEETTVPTIVPKFDSTRYIGSAASIPSGLLQLLAPSPTPSPAVDHVGPRNYLASRG